MADSMLYLCSVPSGAVCRIARGRENIVVKLNLLNTMETIKKGILDSFFGKAGTMKGIRRAGRNAGHKSAAGSRGYAEDRLHARNAEPARCGEWHFGIKTATLFCNYPNFQYLRTQKNIY
jgi:hypothetical protein